MKLQDFLESSYMTAQIRYQKVRDTETHALMQATQGLINAHRAFNRHLAYIKLLFTFLGTKLGVIRPLKSVEQIYNDMKAEDLAQTASATVTQPNTAVTFKPGPTTLSIVE